MLDSLDTLIAAGLSSRRKSIVNATVVCWDSTFGDNEVLQYPPKSRKALQKLQQRVEIRLPSFETFAELVSLLFIEDAPADHFRAIHPHFRWMTARLPLTIQPTSTPTMLFQARCFRCHGLQPRESHHLRLVLPRRRPPQPQRRGARHLDGGNHAMKIPKSNSPR
jgi:hypothetical protein